MIMEKTASSDDVVRKSILEVEGWMIRHDFKGYEPFDGLSSYLYPLTFGNNFLKRLLQRTPSGKAP